MSGRSNVSMPHADCPACKKVYGEGPFDEEESRALIMEFDLHEPCYVGGIQKAIPNFQTISGSSDSNFIVGFRIMIPDDHTEIKAAHEKAANFVNYLSHKTRTNVRCKYPRIIRMVRGKPFITSEGTLKSISRPKPFDLDLSQLSAILTSTDSILIKRLEHARKGLAAFVDNDWEEAVRNYYQIIEDSGTKEELEFASLRHAVSHVKLTKPKTIEDLQNKFGLKVQAGAPVNFNDPDNRLHLQIYAYRLRAAAETYLDAEMAKLKL